MAHLDCENTRSTLLSLCQAYGTTEEKLQAFFDSVDLDQHYETGAPILSPDRELKRLLEQRIGPIRYPITRTYWFHLTRVPIDTPFEEGILPLDQALPRIWATLFSVFQGTPHETRLRALHAEGVKDFQYTLKTRNVAHRGPYAMLVREIGFNADAAGNHDYLKTPEIVEGICNSYAKKYDECIQRDVEAMLTPTIVKFWSEHEHGLPSAIHYAYASHHNEEIRQSSNTCFDGGGQPVPPDRIVYVQHLR